MTARERERAPWIAGGIGIVILAITTVVAPWSFPHAWLAALFCWLAWPLGSLALVLIHALTGGKWGWAIRPQLVAGIATLPLVLPFVLPVLFVLPSLYPWAQPAIQSHLPNGFYLNLPFFAVRGIVYLIVWLGLGGAVLWTLGRQPSPLPRLAPPGLILLALTFTFASIDLTLSLQPAFKSSVYGMLTSTEAVLFALSIAVLGVTVAPGSKPDAREDLGKLLLALVILWAYLDFMQMLIVWQSDLPDEAAWYGPRLSHGWQYVAGLIAVLHFALPFFLLLWPQLQRSRGALRMIAAVLVIMEVPRAWWLVLPSAGRGIGVADVAAMLAVFGLAAGLALRAPRLPQIAGVAGHG